MQEKQTPTYSIEGPPGEKFILCHICKSASWNPNDIEDKYCAKCKMRHRDGYMENGKYLTVPAAAANHDVVLALTHHLINAFEAFLDNPPSGKNTSFVDAFMAAHNFHAHVVLDMVARTGESIWLQSAISTFEMRIKAEIEKGKS